VVEGPPWIRKDKFDVDARMDPTTTPVQMAPMMAHLLADRFALRSHTEQRPADVYVLKLARGDGRLGPGLKRSSAPCIEAKTAKQPLPQVCRTGQLQNLPVSLIADFLQLLSFQRIDRPVLDRTGLTGYFDADLEATAEFGPPPPPPGVADRIDRASLPSIFSVLPDRLGLKLDAQRGPVKVSVIDRLERPEER